MVHGKCFIYRPYSTILPYTSPGVSSGARILNQSLVLWVDGWLTAGLGLIANTTGTVRTRTNQKRIPWHWRQFEVPSVSDRNFRQRFQQCLSVKLRAGSRHLDTGLVGLIWEDCIGLW